MPLIRACLVVLLFAAPVRAEVPDVVTDIAPVESLVAMVMQGLGEPDLIVEGGASPHGYALRPSQARALQEADLVIWIGPELTPWLGESLDTLAPEAKRLELLALEGTRLLAFREEDAAHDDHDEHDGHDDDDAHDDHDAHDDDDGHDGHDAHEEHEEDDAHEEHAEHDGHDDHAHEGTDPHAWLDPENGRTWLSAIADMLAEADPQNAAAYRANAEAGAAELERLQAEMAAQLKPMKGQPYVTFHDAYQYFEVRFGLTPVGSVSDSDATSPGPAGLAQLQADLEAAAVTCAFSEPQFDAGLLKAATDREDLKVIPLDPLGVGQETGPGLYPGLLRDMARAFASCAERG